MNYQSRNKGKNLKLMREYRGYTQTKLCKSISGLSQSNLSKFEDGFEGMISNEKLEVIAKLLDFHIDFLDAKMPEFKLNNN